MRLLTSRAWQRTRRLIAVVVAMLVVLPMAVTWSAGAASAHDGHGETAPFTALVFSKTAAFRHGSIPAGVAAIQKLGADHGFTVDATEDSGAFTDENLAKYDVVIWLSTTGDVLDPSQQAAFERYVKAGGGYAGVHAASDTEYDWPWYGELVGAWFSGHPAGTPAHTVKVQDPAHPSTAGLPSLWNRTDELYNFRTNPMGKVHVLASLDESSYSGGTMGAEHPISWCRDYDGGRAWYTGLGHTDASFSDPQFLTHLLGGIRTAAGVVSADCAATLPASFEKVTLDDNTANPMELDIAEDGRVFYVDRGGDVRVIQPNGNVSTAGTLPVYTGQEFGLLGIALDPDFATNHWLYLYHSPAGTASVDRVTRYTVSGNSLDLASATQIIEIPVQRNECCHAGGALEFDNDGNLYIATGDNSNPFASDGYAPLDERAGRAAWDSQRSSANTNSLSGKILKITPKDAGGYDIPAGNLFAPGTAKTRPEIFGMGFRNPFRIGLDEQTGAILVADYGPDAGSSSPTRGPDGRVEWNIVDKPGFYGWPYCVGNNTPYIDYDFATGQSGSAYNCAAPVNDSPNNTGLTQLPPAIGAELWQGKSSTANPEIGGSGAPMTSGTYAYDPALKSDRKWPAYFDGKAIWADWNNSRLFTVQLNDAHTDVVDLNRFLPNLPMTRPHALQFGPDGALYMIEWGSGFGGNNADSGIYRIDYVQGNRAPIARATATPLSGPAPLKVDFDGSASRDPDGTEVTYAWDFDGDGTTDSTDPVTSHTYTAVGDYTARLTVTDSDGRTAVSNIDIVVGNTAPKVEIIAPVDGGFFEFGDTIAYQVKVTDPEDGVIDCDKVVVQPALGHDEHAHGYEQYTGCSGTFPLPGDEGHVGADIFGTITATYTDKGAPGASALTGQDTVVVHTKRKEAEFFDATGRTGGGTNGDPGVVVEAASDSLGGGSNIGYIEPGDWIRWDVMNLTNIGTITLRAASDAGGADWEVRTGSPDGPAVAKIRVEPTAGWQSYQYFSGTVSGDTATVSGPLYFVQLTGGSNINWIDFGGRGVTENQRPALSLTATPTTGDGPLEVGFTATATDPDGDDPITYTWNFGDGATGDTGRTGAATHTYTKPGSYRATVTATDSRGAKASTYVAIRVNTPLPTCFTGRSDGFDGTALDTTRWDSNVRVDGDLSVADGHLVIKLAAADLYGATGGATPNLVLQHLPGGAFEATTKVTFPAVRQYQQAGLIIYGDDNNYLKLVMQGRTATPNAAGRVVQFLTEVGGTASETNSAALGASFPETFWLRLSSSNGLDVTAQYSADGNTWSTISGTRSLAGINEPRIGLWGTANQAAAMPITAKFDYFTLTPDDTATDCTVKDTTAPVVSVTSDPAAPTGANGWFTGPVTLAATATDDVTTAPALEYRIGDGAWAAYTGPVSLTKDGAYAVQFRATDKAGNASEVKTVDVRIDSAGPKVTVKDGTEFTVGSGGVYSKVSFKLNDPNKVDRLTLNGVEKDLTDDVWSDLNGVRPGVFGGKEGTNTLVVFDVAGNSTTVTFTLDTTGPAVTVKDGPQFTLGSDGVYATVSFKLNDPNKVDRLTLNGVEKDLTDNVWSDLNGVRPGVFGARLGENTLVVHDVVGNATTVTFTLASPVAVARDVVAAGVAAGDLTADQAKGLTDRLDNVERHSGTGRTVAATTAVDTFVARVETSVTQAERKAVLLALADLMRAGL